MRKVGEKMMDAYITSDKIQENTVSFAVANPQNLPRAGRKGEDREAIVSTFINNLEDDYMAPEQFFSQSNFSEFSGEQKLVLAIFEDAVKCFLMPEELWYVRGRSQQQSMRKKGKFFYGKLRRPRLIQEAEEWLWSDDCDPFTCRWVCEHFGFHIEPIRVALRKVRNKLRKEHYHTYERKNIPDIFGGRQLPQKKLIDLVRSYGKIERWRGLTNSDFQAGKFWEWRQLFSVALRLVSLPQITWAEIGRILEFTGKTACGLFYQALKNYTAKNPEFLLRVVELNQKIDALVDPQEASDTLKKEDD